ncbi:MAG: biotin--[acetyl-CoA-carboxylase] ligase [Rhodocyclaceae bacterium]|nr:biotin--[acetyl-CoA-carboxylase] ligase [Rhodocyclaceae bacterium]MCA3147261.1 biotin--[acetyl-CoA-carboxylase] ligase [Rhodocyclaceae bacterium]
MNPLTLATLRLLSDGGLRSGEQMAAALGVTRATVWNAMREAESLGLEVQRLRGQGYRLAASPAWLDANRITAALGAGGARFQVQVAEAVDSTNTQLLAAAAAGAPTGSVLAAELQTGGRGRRGRAWTSGLGSSLTFSLLWRFEQGAAGLSGLSLAVGVAVAQALAAAGASGIGLKWPNDILFQGRKLGGILVELQGDALGPAAAVVGIGINVRLPAPLRAAVEQPVADLAEAGCIPERNGLLAGLLARLAEVMERFTAEGFGPFESAFRALHVLHGQAAQVLLPDGRVLQGVVEGTGGDGALLLRTAQGVVRLHGGEASLRAAGAVLP